MSPSPAAQAPEQSSAGGNRRLPPEPAPAPPRRAASSPKDTRDSVQYRASNQSYYFLRNGQAIKESRISINNRSINYGYLTPKEIFLETMKALGYNQQDMTTGIISTIFSLVHFCKNYFAHITDLTIQDNREFFVSGLNSLGSTLTTTWEENFNGGSNSQTCLPIIYARCTKLLQVRAGRQLTVI